MRAISLRFFRWKNTFSAFSMALGLASFGAAADTPLQFNQIELTDGRVLHTVVVKSYDAEGDRILVVADRHAQFIPLRLIPSPVAQRLRDTAPRTGQNLSVVAATVAAPAAGGTAGVSTPTSSVPTPTSGPTTTAAAIAARRQAVPTVTPTPTPAASPTVPAK